jgi:hypothetical protein
MLAGVRRRIVVGAAAAAIVVVVVALLRGGGGDSDPAPKPIGGAGKEVANVVGRLELATRQRRFDVVCNELFTRAARVRAGGSDCISLLRSTAKDVHRPRIRLLSVRLNGDRAEARVRTRAQGQTAVEETIDFLREGGRYRIAALRG